MLHNQVAINASAAIHAKGTSKSNAQLNFFSTNLMVRVNIDLIPMIGAPTPTPAIATSSGDLLP